MGPSPTRQPIVGTGEDWVLVRTSSFLLFLVTSMFTSVHPPTAFKFSLLAANRVHGNMVLQTHFSLGSFILTLNYLNHV